MLHKLNQFQQPPVGSSNPMKPAYFSETFFLIDVYKFNFK